MYNVDKIKLIIWDLDETFWKGTLSEGDVEIPDASVNLLKESTDAGIMNSICSKNSWDQVEKELEQNDLLDYFVFPSVNWEAKGARVKQIISDMQLREENVLFLDDNHFNIEEVRFCCPKIMTDGPECIERLRSDILSTGKKDLEHKRLKQYRVLENKNSEKGNYSSNEDFLVHCNIQAEIMHDCIEHIDRLHDLILRTNQLNFTKIRCSKEELENTIRDPSYETGYVKVTDRFGDYGIVGFYALKENRLEHFAFSCRTLGMGIEQYVYKYLNRPELIITGEVISDLSEENDPYWINQSNTNKSEKNEKMQLNSIGQHTVLVKGPCDLFQIYPYITNTELFDTEFNYTTDQGLGIESVGHTTNIVEAGRLSQDQKKMVLNEVPFTDAGMYSDNIFKYPYKVIFISILTDANLGVYQRKETGEKFAFLEYTHSLTDPKEWKYFINNQYRTNGFSFTEEILKDFSDKYEFLGRNTPEQIVENIDYIRNKINEDCILVVMLGGELYYEKNTNEAYNDRHIVHKAINDKLKQYAENRKNVVLMDVNKYLTGQESFYDHFNHYTKPVYYSMAKEMVEIINTAVGVQVKNTNPLKMVVIRIKEILSPSYRKIKRLWAKK